VFSFLLLNKHLHISQTHIAEQQQQQQAYKQKKRGNRLNNIQLGTKKNGERELFNLLKKKESA
jgi:hypothetical protein